MVSDQTWSVKSRVVTFEIIMNELENFFFLQYHLGIKISKIEQLIIKEIKWFIAKFIEMKRENG